MPNSSIENEANALTSPRDLTKIHVGVWHEGGSPEDARFSLYESLKSGVHATIQSLKNLAGSVNGQVIGTHGYYAQGDCEPLLYKWDAASTATDDGVDSSHPGLVVQPTAVVGAGRWIATGISRVNVRWYGAKGDNIQDDTPYLQRAIDRVVNGFSDVAVTFVPVGAYKTTDTLHLGYGTDYSHVTLLGADTRPGRHVWGVQLRPTFTDRPVVNFQGARTSAIDGIAIIGTLATTGLGNATQAAWDAVVGANLNKQFVGVSIDAYSGADPGTGYTNAPSGWSKFHSSDVRIRNCQITQCANGVAVKPSGGSGFDNNGDYVVIEGSCFDKCKFAFSINGSQARVNRMVGCVVADCFAAIGTGVIGVTGLGQEVNLFETMVERTNYFVYHNAADWSPQIKIIDCGGEGAGSIIWAVNSPSCVVTIERNTVNFYIGNDAAFEHRTHVDVGTCHLRLLNNRFTIQNTTGTITRRAFIVRCPSTSVVSGNVVDLVSGWPGLFRVPPRASVTAKAGVSIGNSQEYQFIPCNNGAVISAFYNLSATTGRQYSGQATINFLRSGVVANDYVSFTTTGSECYIFKVISVAEYTDGSVVVLEQVNETTSTTPISTAAAITQVTSSSRYVVIHRPETGNILAPEVSGTKFTSSNIVTTDNPAFDAVQTWNAGAIAFNGIKLNVTDAASAAGSNLLNLQLSSVSRLSVNKTGLTAINGPAIAGNGEVLTLTNSFGTASLRVATGGLFTVGGDIAAVGSASLISSSAHLKFGTGSDAGLSYIGAGILGITNGSTGPGKIAIDLVQGANLERFKMEWASSVARIGTAKAGSGTARDFAIITDDTIRMVFYGGGGINTGGSAITTYMLQQTSSRLQIQAPETIATAGATGNAGEICWDTSYLYICTAANTWRRIAHASW